MVSMMKGLRKSKSGFTLVEVLVVVTLLAILLAVTIPSYLSGRPKRLLGAQANKIAQIIRYGRLQAIRDNKKYYLEFIPELDMYRLWGPDGWYAYADPDRLYGDWDGDGDTFLDGDLDDEFLNPLNSDNLPIHTCAPRLGFEVNETTRVLEGIYRDFENKNYVADQAIFPFDVDLRMNPLTWNPGSTDIRTRPTDTWPTAVAPEDQVNILSREPLLFIVFFPDGTVQSSWQFDQPVPSDLGNEIRDLIGAELGVTEIFLQVRGEVNPASQDMFDHPAGGNYDGTSDGSPYQTLSYEDAISETFGRRILINHATGRIKVENYIPVDLDFDEFGNPLIFF